MKDDVDEDGDDDNGESYNNRFTLIRDGRFTGSKVEGFVKTSDRGDNVRVSVIHHHVVGYPNSTLCIFLSAHLRILSR